MPSALAPGFLVDQYGRPIAPRGGFGNLHKRSWQDELKRPSQPSHYADYAALLAPRNFQHLVSESRALASKSLVSGLIDSKTGYVSASGWRPRFDGGSDAKAGEDALQWLSEAINIANIRGSRFTWRDSWALSTRNYADAGAFFVLLTMWPDTDQPALQFIEAHRIGQRDEGKGLVESGDAFTDITDESGASRRVRGAYKGLNINNGIITNENGTEVAARILGATKDDDQDVSLRDLVYCGAPTAYSENRPCPRLSSSLLDFLAIELAQTAQLDQQIADARRDLVETTATGRPDLGAALTGMNSPTPEQTPTEVVERGQYRFIKSGNTITPIDTARPSDQWMNFDLRVVKRASRAVRWSWEMLDPEALRGGATRALQDQVNTYIAEDFGATAPAVRRCLRYFLAKGIQSGAIAFFEDWRNFSVAPPAEFEVDRAAARIDLEEYAAGRTAMSTLVAKDGHTIGEVYRRRANDWNLAGQVAKETGVPIDIIRGVPTTISSGAQSSAADGAKPGAAGDPRDNPQVLPAAA